MSLIINVNDMTKLSQIDLNLFVVFDTIYSERNLTRTADHLSITQPAVSNALARLRKALNDPLFVKTPSGMQPTALAESIAERVSEALQSIQTVAQQTESFDPKTSQRIFRIRLTDMQHSMILPQVIKNLAIEAPNVELHVSDMARTDLPKALAQGTIEIASEIPLLDTTDLIWRTISRDNYVCALRPGHPHVGKEFTLDQYLDLRHLHVSSRPKGAGAVDVALRKLGKKRRIGVRTQSYISAAEIIRSSDLAITIPERWALSQNLAVLPLPIALKPLEFRLFRHVRTEGDAPVTWLFDKIVQYAEALPPGPD